MPRFGHLERFEKRLNPTEKKRSISYKWMSVAASIVLLIGFWLGSNQANNSIVLADVSPQMQEAESFFMTTISQEIKEIEKFRNPKTEQIIEDALNQLEKLEDKYKELVKALNDSNKDRRVIYAMINNYQSRIEILQNVLKQVDEINNPKETQNEEIYI
ncbi:MAG: hypothetical protein JKZ00_05125 [Flavobacteriaceae bacterium]|nr:hypothetical protein [Flavobacteriaceae bacterium]